MRVSQKSKSRRNLAARIVAVAQIGILQLFVGQASAVEIEEITVTAQKRAQNLQDVPLSVTAFSGDHIQELGFSDMHELAANVPGLTWEGTAKSKPSLFLRGVGNSDFETGSRSPVAFYLDNVYQGAPFAVTPLMSDIERVEVLRGPQGTLWGKNTTAGLINVVTKKATPGEGVQGNFGATVGRFGQQNYKGAIGFDLSDSSAARIAVAHSTDDGAYNNFGPDFTGDTGGGDATGARVNLIFQPTDRLALDFTARYSSTDGEATPTKLLGTKDPADAANGFRANCPFPDRGMLGTQCVDRDGFANSGGIRQVAQNFKSQEDTENTGVSMTIDYDFDSVTLTSITAYNDAMRDLHKDNDSGSSILSEANQDDNFHGFSQELRLASNDADWGQWLVGAYYYKDSLDYFRSTLRSSNPADSSFANNIAAARLQDIDTETAAIFGDATFNVSDQWSVSAGVRLTYDDRDGTASGFEYNVDPSFPGTDVRVSRQYALANIDPARINFLNEHRQRDWLKFSGKIGTQYYINDHVNVWGSVARGFKGGDPNSGAFSRPEDFNISNPEFVTSVEVGVKSTFVDGGVQINASIYNYDYEDKQVFTEINGGGAVGNLSVLSNAAALTIRGADIELAWNISDNWYAQGAFAYIHSEFDNFLQTTRGTTVDRSGNTTALTPEYSISGVLRYEHQMASGSVIYAQGTVTFKDDMFFTNDNNPLAAQNSYSLLGASLGWKSPDEKWDVNVWGKNLTDEGYFVDGFDLSFRGAILNNIGDPMRYGVTARLSF